MDHCIGCHTCVFTVAYAVLRLEVLRHIKVFHIRCTTAGGEGETPYPFLKIIKTCSGFGKKALIFSIPRLNCSNQSALILRNLPCPKQFLVVHLHIYDISNLIFVHWNCIDSICRNLGGLVV